MRQVATQIENETQVGGNTASRVGGLFNDIVDELDVIDTSISDERGDIEELTGEVFNMEEHSVTVAHTVAQHYSIEDDGKLVYASQASATIYYIPVTQGDYINVNVIFPQSRPIKLGVYSQIAANQTCLQYVTRANTNTFNETIRIEVDGYFAMYIYVATNYTPTTFTYSKITYTKPDESRIDTLETDVASLKDSIGVRKYKECVAVSGFYVDDNTGEIKSNNNQSGFRCPVNAGDELHITMTMPSSTNKARYGFSTSVPAVGVNTVGFGYVEMQTQYNFVLTAPVTGYFVITDFYGITSMSVYTQEGASMQDLQDELNEHQSEIEELDTALEKFKKPSYCSAFDLPLSGTGSASSLAQGQYLQSSIGVYTDDDMCGFRFTPNGSSFEIRFGKLANIGGTMFAVKKSSSGSQLITYKINDSGSYVTVKTETLPFTLLSGVEYYARVERYVYNNIIFVCTLTSNDGRYFQTKAGYSAGRGWGKYYIIAQTGSASNISIREWSAYKKECWLMFVGHSYVEGVSTEGFSENKFSKMMQEELGYKECAIMGMGGDTISGAASKFANYVDVMNYRPKYAAIVAGANDSSASYNSMISAFQSFISKCEANNIIPILFTINPRYDTNNPQWNNVNTWIRQRGELFVDMYYCFVDANGNAIADHYLDQIHPTEEVHKAIFQRMIEDVPEILNEQ